MKIVKLMKLEIYYIMLLYMKFVKRLFEKKIYVCKDCGRIFYSSIHYGFHKFCERCYRLFIL